MYLNYKKERSESRDSKTLPAQTFLSNLLKKKCCLKSFQNVSPPTVESTTDSLSCVISLKLICSFFAAFQEHESFLTKILLISLCDQKWNMIKIYDVLGYAKFLSLTACFICCKSSCTEWHSSRIEWRSNQLLYPYNVLWTQGIKKLVRHFKFDVQLLVTF